MSEVIIKDFHAGWCPSDSPLNARAGALLRMDSIELDQNGDLTMPDGVLTIGGAYASNAHTIFSKFIGTGSPHHYLALENNAIYRNLTSIGTGGSTTRAAFVAAWDYVMCFSGAKRIRDDGTTTTNLGQAKATVAPTTSLNGAGVLTGDYNYLQINVFSNGAYVARSAPSAIAATLSPAANKIQVTAEVPTSPANEVWIFRNGGTLDQYYRVKRLTSSYATPFDDNLSDNDVRLIGVTLNLTALSINSTDLPDDILGAEGPINGRLLLCTKNTVYFTEVNSPESYVPGQGIPYSTNISSGAENFLWIKKVAENVIAIGTTTNIYTVTGTFLTLPDGTLDVYLRPLNVKYPPIDIFVETYNNALVFMSKTGWRMTSLSGESVSLVDDRIDRIYRGESFTVSAGNGIPIYLYPFKGPGAATLRYSCAIGQNKLFCTLPSITNSDPTQAFGKVMHVYDFVRKYWRVITTAPTLLHAQEDGAIVGFFDSDSKLKRLTHTFLKTNDGTKQTVTILFPVLDMGSPRRRKDWQTLKVKVYTANEALSIYASINDGASQTLMGTATASDLLEKFIDLSSLGASKSIQIKLEGTIQLFKLSDISVNFTERPEQTVYIKVPKVSFGELDGKKIRPRVWPIFIDTLGGNVTFTPIIDGVDGTTTVLNSSYPKHIPHYFITDIFCENLGYKLSGAALFELYNVGAPEIVQALPTGKLLDQLGPVEFFRYGKISRLMIRLLSSFTGNIPYTIYFQDTSSETGNLAVVANKEDSYEIRTAKLEGEILRVVLGPTASPFYRYYAFAEVTKSGRDTEHEWVQL
jgi:hypothetical protein